jgi:hypothetical protein
VLLFKTSQLVRRYTTVAEGSGLESAVAHASDGLNILITMPIKA